MSRFNLNTYKPVNDSAFGHGRADDQFVVRVIGQGMCSCGCGDESPNRFLQGHDQRLKGILIRACATETPIRALDPATGQTTEYDALVLAQSYNTASLNWVAKVTDGAQAHLARAKGKPAQTPAIEFQVKVGRWEYTATRINGARLLVQTKNGNREAIDLGDGKAKFL